jgi:hypothetical protein
MSSRPGGVPSDDRVRGQYDRTSVVRGDSHVTTTLEQSNRPGRFPGNDRIRGQRDRKPVVRGDSQVTTFRKHSNSARG